MLGEAQQVNIGLRRWRNRPAARFEKARESQPRLLCAQIARHGGFQLARRGGGAPKTKSFADRRPAGTDEDIGLQPLYGGGLAQEGEANESQDID
jgi:hypothetical protein